MLTEFFGNAPEDEEVAVVVRRAIDEMKTRGATAVDLTVPDLAKLIAASNLLTQELKVYLGGYLKSAGAYASSVDDLLESGLHSSSLQGILDAANAMPNDYLTSDDYKVRLASRETLGKAIVSVMDTNRLDAIVYPTIRRIAPLVGGGQPGSNAALSANTGFPAISVPAGFTPAGFPVGVELLGRAFAEPTLLALAFDYEQATRHRRPPVFAANSADAKASALPAATAGSIRVEVTATGARSVYAGHRAFRGRRTIQFRRSDSRACL